MHRLLGDVNRPSTLNIYPAHGTSVVTKPYP